MFETPYFMNNPDWYYEKKIDEYRSRYFLTKAAPKKAVKSYRCYCAKYYCTDIGLRNVRLGLRQQEETHIMENIIYNELLVRGYAIDVGVITVPEKNQEGKTERKNCEIDFVARKGNLQYYIQSAYRMDDPEKSSTELRPLLTVRDSFKKIVISYKLINKNFKFKFRRN